MLDGANLSKKDRREGIAPPHSKGRNGKRSSGGLRRFLRDVSEQVFLTLWILLHPRGEGDRCECTGGQKLLEGRHGKEQRFSFYHKLLAFSN